MDPGKEPGEAVRKDSTVKDAASKLGKQSHLRSKLYVLIVIFQTEGKA